MSEDHAAASDGIVVKVVDLHKTFGDLKVLAASVSSCANATCSA
jgi:hypothetical protein